MLWRVGVFLSGYRPDGHSVQEAIANERVEKHRANMREDRRKEKVSEDRMGVSQEGVQHRMRRQDGRQLHRSEHQDGIVTGREHTPANERHRNH